MSLNGLACPPRICSGDKYPGVPATIPVSVRVSAVNGVSTIASPKSNTFGCPSEVKNKFSGFTSRCVTPFECAAAKPSANAAPIAATLRQAQGPRETTARRASRSNNSVTA